MIERLACDHIKFLDAEILKLKRELYEVDKKWRDAKATIEKLKEENRELTAKKHSLMRLG